MRDYHTRPDWAIPILPGLALDGCMTYTPAMSCTFLIYGSYGYTGDLIARWAVERGHTPILAGRNPEKLATQAVALGLQHFAFTLDDFQALHKALEGVDAVLHCAGPFHRTARPMVDACLRTSTHYLDITGEIAVFESLAAMDAEAREAGVMLLPGVGFDVVPSDCLAAHLKRRLPSATRLTLAIRALSTTSHGTAFTAVENLDRAGMVRRNGRLTPVPAGSLTRQIDLGRGPVACVALPWGDVSTAYYSTGIPNIEVYFAFPEFMRSALIASRHLGWLLVSSPVQAALKAGIRLMPLGPSAEQRARGSGVLWGEVVDDAGERRVTRLRTPEGYALTERTAVAAVERVLGGRAEPGFQTPSLAFGADFIMDFDGVQREDVD